MGREWFKSGRNYSLWTRFQEHILQVKLHRTIPASYIFAYHVCCSYFLSQVIFLFLLSLGMVMYANEVEIIGRQKLPEIKN